MAFDNNSIIQDPHMDSSLFMKDDDGNIHFLRNYTLMYLVL